MLPFPDGVFQVQHEVGLRIAYTAGEGKVCRVATVGDREIVDTRDLTVGDEGSDPFASWWRAYIRGPKPPPDRDSQPLRFIDLFSSVGGLSLGASEAIAALGMRGMPLLAADVDARALQVYRSNFRPRQTIAGSVRSTIDYRVSGTGDDARFAYEPTVIDERLVSLVGATDLILAGPPCQGHSSLNNRSRHDDPKNLLYLTVPATAVALGARHVVVENVPNVVSDRNGVVQTTMTLLRDNGYYVTSGTLAADQFGWPQTRKRFFLVASRDTKPIALDTLKKLFLRDARPVWWLVEDLESTPVDGSDVMNSVPELSEQNRQRIDWLFDNDEYTLPNAIRPDCHKDGTTYEATYGRMYRDQPAPTITGGFLTPGRGRFIHPTQRRVLTPHEAARLQGFPDWFSLTTKSEPPSRSELGRWIGNAVPSLLGFIATLSALGGEVKVAESDTRIAVVESS
ncbi:DNA cytosine methyltransferase [Mycobacterium fragae]|nr:DNA cytosine methyltransferase [Mycobacterium fragae]MCV7402180.1 DNA cytosine methyltransferase [Mycobacterium fragae]